MYPLWDAPYANWVMRTDRTHLAWCSGSSRLLIGIHSHPIALRPVRVPRSLTVHLGPRLLLLACGTCTFARASLAGLSEWAASHLLYRTLGPRGPISRPAPRAVRGPCLRLIYANSIPASWPGATTSALRWTQQPAFASM